MWASSMVLNMILDGGTVHGCACHAMIGQSREVMPHIKDSDMEEFGEQVMRKLQSMTDEEFSEIFSEAAE